LDISYLNECFVDILFESGLTVFDLAIVFQNFLEFTHLTGQNRDSGRVLIKNRNVSLNRPNENGEGRAAYGGQYGPGYRN